MTKCNSFCTQSIPFLKFFHCWIQSNRHTTSGLYCTNAISVTALCFSLGSTSLLRPLLYPILVFFQFSCHLLSLDLTWTPTEHRSLLPHLFRGKILTPLHLLWMILVSVIEVMLWLVGNFDSLLYSDLDYNYLPWGDTKSITLLCPPTLEPYVAIAELVDKVHTL